MNKNKFIGTVSFEDISKTFDPNGPWNPLALDEIPYPVVNPAPRYLFTLGSGCYSAPTTSVHNIRYISGIDVFRQDIRGTEIMIDVDHYVATPSRDTYGVFLEPPDKWHRLKLQDERLNYIKPQWSYYIRNVLAGKATL